MNAQPAALFAIASQLVAPLWLLLIVSLYVQRARSWARWSAFVGLPVLFGVLYAVALIPQVPFESGGFDSLANVRLLFANDWMLLAGWVHYLVFDYFVGAWIADDSVVRGVPRPLVIVCLVGTFMAGPLGLLVYLAARSVLSRRNEALAT